jgi:hypothetical protein
VALLCAHCQVGADRLQKECGGYLLEYINDEVREHAQEYGSLPLWRLVAGAGRKWRRKNGERMRAIGTSAESLETKSDD